MLKLAIFTMLFYFILFSPFVFADYGKERLFFCEECPNNRNYFITTSIFVEVERNFGSKIIINIAKYNESDEISPWIPNILPSKYDFFIKDTDIEYRNSELIGVRFFENDSKKPDVMIPVEINITRFTFFCEKCIEKLSDEPFEKYRFLFPFSVSRNGIVASGSIMDSIFVEIPEEYLFASVGKDNVLGGGLVKVMGYIDSLPEDLKINEMPKDAFGLKINGKRVERMGFDAFNHVLLIEYGRPLQYSIFALIIPILILIVYALSFKFNFEKTVPLVGFLCSLAGIHWFFINDLKFVFWDYELLLVGLIGLYYFKKS